MFERTPCDGNYYYFFAIVLHKYNICTYINFVVLFKSFTFK